VGVAEMKDFLRSLSRSQYFALLLLYFCLVETGLYITGVRSWAIPIGILAIVVFDRVLGRIEFGRW
jgi:hypothetical protein